MRISDWSSDVCSSDLPCVTIGRPDYADQINEFTLWRLSVQNANATAGSTAYEFNAVFSGYVYANGSTGASPDRIAALGTITGGSGYVDGTYVDVPLTGRSEEHTSELQSLMRISYAVFCLK